MQSFKEFIPGTGLVTPPAQPQSQTSPTSPQDRGINTGSGSLSLKAQAKEFIPNLPPQDRTHYPPYVEPSEWYLNHSSQSREAADNLVEVMLPRYASVSDGITR